MERVYEVERGVERRTAPAQVCRPIIGIDPGVTGALCLLRRDGSAAVLDLPTLDTRPRRVLDLHRLHAIFGEWEAQRPTVWLELVGPRPTDGSVAAFSFGGNWWALRALCVAHGFPLETVAPIRWRRAMGLQAGDGKDQSRARASSLFPHLAHHWPLKGHDGRAESVLIAAYGQRAAASFEQPTTAGADR